MGRPRKAVDAAVLAAAVGVDRAVEGNVGALVAGDDRPRALDRDLGAGRGGLLGQVPAVVDGDAVVALEAAGHVEPGAAGAPGSLRDLAQFVANHRADFRTKEEHTPPKRGGHRAGNRLVNVGAPPIRG